jgi:spermidine/putrescine-binding protein
VAEAGLATGSKDPYNMNAAELSKAKQFLQAAKPAFLDLVSQNTGVVSALANGTAWFTSENLGTDIRVKQAGGPLIKAAIPKEGVVGWLDAEMKMIGPDESRFEQFINAWGQAEWIPPLFKEFEEAWFNEKAYKLLVNQGLQHLADAVGYNDPEGALKAHLKGPQKNPGAYTQVFNEVFGA